MAVDSKSLEMLEFHRIREILAGFTSFSTSRELALNLEPLVNHDQVSLLLRQSAEARRLLAEEPDFSIGGVHDIREAARMAALGKILEPQTLVEVQQTLTASRQLRRSLNRQSKGFPRLWDIASGITEMPQLEKDIGNCLTPAAELLDSASPKLSTIRQRLKKAREHLLIRLDGIIKSSRGTRIIQEPIITEREGRYVIPIKMEHRKEIKGIVHDVSNTGATLFIEPWATLELGNELRELVMEEKHEVERILRDLSLKVGAQESEIARNIALMAELDLALAKARYAYKARAVEPVLTNFGNDDTGIIKLVDARHPLLGEKAVPLSVEMGRDFSILLITGPNMGGKTVTLKTIGLLSLMTQAGLPIPASAETIVPVFDDIFADIGDEQSIEQTLSTFSWHIGNIVRIINRATRMSLVLLDELGTSTDPAEGSALARSILLYLLSRRIMTMATTHYNDLKAFAHTTPGLENASLDFDPATRMPTYHLTVGIPGGSNALAIAAHLGLPADIISRAREMLSQGTQQLEALLADLADERQKLMAIRQQLEKEGEEAERRNLELENRLKSLKAEERKILQETRDRIVLEAADLQKEIRQAMAELRREKTREGIEQAKKALAEMQERLKSEVWQTKTEGTATGETADDSVINIGDTVLLKEANLAATVLSVSVETGQIEVQAGRAKLTLSRDSVEKVTAASGKVKPAFTPVTREISHRAVPRELDLRGRRADEIEPMLDSYLNSASLASLSEVRVIHGLGTGTVRQIVRELLTSHPLVKSFRPGERGEGGDGATVVRL
jgi:DNA mismatch repair protein MutS2